MDRFEYALPNLGHNEIQVAIAYNVRLYDGDNKTSFEGGKLTLTSHRLCWISGSGSGGSCLSLGLGHVVYIDEEIPGAFHFTSSPKLVLHLSASLPGKNPGPVNRSIYNHVKLSFKDGLDNSFATALRETVQKKSWEVTQNQQHPTERKAPPVIKPRTGIVGIERGIQEKQKATDQSISVAFKDLSRLMQMAKEMVNLANNISTKIRERQGTITEDETIQFKSYLLSLGIVDPVTRDAYSTETKYLNHLAHEIVSILETPIREQGGMMSLTDAYCRVNRARGLELVSPDDLLAACKYLASSNLPLRMHQFDSGVRVLQLASHTHESIVESTSIEMESRGSLTAEELSQSLGISVVLAKERLITTEKYGKACRDESIEGLRFYPNLFLHPQQD